MDGKWIWASSNAESDTYGEFYSDFTYSGGKSILSVSADSNYAVYVNGTLAASGQYPDFPYYKVYDEIDISEHCLIGENSLAVVVWYFGQPNMSYYPGNASLIFELTEDSSHIISSDENTRLRISRAYINGYKKLITSQLGFSFRYDATREDGWKTGNADDLTKSVIVEQNPVLHLRPTDRLTVGERRNAGVISTDGKCRYLCDIGCEEVGYLDIKFTTRVKQTVNIAYGEHIVDGGVRRIIGNRDFSVEITADGECVYVNPFRRLGARYLEVTSENPIELEYIGLRPVYYKLDKISRSFDGGLRDSIYNVCVRTLELCMHDHYEDCPWREQGLYAMDSRNQMLCGYYAFGEYSFPRACLKLMSEDNREDGMLSICIPTKENLEIPSFSLHYITEVYEYVKYSGDTSLLNEVYPKLSSIINVFRTHIEDGILPTFVGKSHWNFYEWSEGLTGKLNREIPKQYDAALNCLFIIALDLMAEMSSIIGVVNDFGDIAQEIRLNVRHKFYDKESGLFINTLGNDGVSELVNALAILSGAANDGMARTICKKLTDEQSGLTPATLSMICFKYDALLKTDKDKYRDYVLENIDAKYKKMLDAGATSFWETELGEKDFNNAGSLCHGWSSMPIYYYCTLL